MKLSLFVTLILSMVVMSSGDLENNVQLNVLYEWKCVDYDWDSADQKQEAIESGDYKLPACILYDVDKKPDGTVIVTAVREDGVPATLMMVSDKVGECGPLLRPYPNWSWHNASDCSGITSVYRVQVKCDHLFVLDCGKIGNEQVCPPRLFIFDLLTDELIKNITIPYDVANNANGTGLLVTPLVIAKDCEDIENTATIFMADIEGFGLAIYYAKPDDELNPIFCRVESNFMKATPPFTTFTINGQSFSLNDGIIGLAPVRNDLYYTDLADDKMYKMRMQDLLNRCPLTKQDADNETQVAYQLLGQSGPIASKECTIFFSNIPETSILCADTCKEFNPDTMYHTVIVQDPVKLQFPSGLKIPQVKGNHDIMILTNRYQRVMTDTINLNETNFRVLTMDIGEIHEKTNCFPPHEHRGWFSQHRECHCKDQRPRPLWSYSHYNHWKHH